MDLWFSVIPTRARPPQPQQPEPAPPPPPQQPAQLTQAQAQQQLQNGNMLKTNNVFLKNLGCDLTVIFLKKIVVLGKQLAYDFILCVVKWIVKIANTF